MLKRSINILFVRVFGDVIMIDIYFFVKRFIGFVEVFFGNLLEIFFFGY